MHYRNRDVFKFWDSRTFNEKLNASVYFYQKCWKPLLKAVLLVAGPLIVLGVGIIIYNINGILNLAFLGQNDDNLTLLFNAFLGFIPVGLSLMMVNLITMECVRLYHESPEEINNLKLIFKNTRKKILPFIGFTLLLGLVMLIANFLLGLVIGALAAITPLLSIFGILGFFFLVCAIFAHTYVIAPAIYFENKGVSKGINKGMTLIKDYFWQTMGLFLGTRLIQFIILNGIIVPAAIAILYFLFRNGGQFGPDNVENTMNRIIIIYDIILLCYFTLNFLTYSFHAVTGSVQYYSLREQKDGTELMKRVNAFNELEEIGE